MGGCKEEGLLLFSLYTFQFAPPDLHQQSGQQPSEPSSARNVPVTEHADKNKSPPPHQTFPHSPAVVCLELQQLQQCQQDADHSSYPMLLPLKIPERANSPGCSALYLCLLRALLTTFIPLCCTNPASVDTHPNTQLKGRMALHPQVPPDLTRLLHPEELQDPGVPLPYLWGCLDVLEKQQEPQSQRQATGSHLRWC